MAIESNVVVIDPAVSKAFPNEASVNAALRGAARACEVKHMPNPMLSADPHKDSASWLIQR